MIELPRRHEALKYSELSFRFERWSETHDVRQEHIKDKGFVLLTVELANKLAEALSGLKVLDAGAGSGYLSRCLSDRGVSIEAVDSKVDRYSFNVGAHFPVEIEDAITRVKQRYYDIVLLVWPDYATPFALNIATALKTTQQLLYCGEGPWGCTGNDDFHKYLGEAFFEKEELSEHLNNTHLQFYGLHDTWYWYEKKGC